MTYLDGLVEVAMVPRTAKAEEVGEKANLHGGPLTLELQRVRPVTVECGTRKDGLP